MKSTFLKGLMKSPLLKEVMAPYQVATESYKLFREAGCNHMQACAWLGNEDGETSFRIGVVGDKRNPDGSLRPPEQWAYGPAQHHQARIESIRKATGIDMIDAPHADQIKGVLWEMTKGGYKHVMPALQASQTMREAITVLVQRYEQSGSQARDINRRTNLGNYWLEHMPENP